MLRPICSTCAPYARVATSLGSGAPSGMKTVDADAEQLGGERDALGVVAGAGGDDAARLLLVGEPGHPGVGAADLERPGPLQVLALEEDRTADPVGQRPAVLQRGGPDHALEQLAGGEDVLEGHGHQR